MVDGRERGVYVEEVIGPSIGDVDVRGMYGDGRFARTGAIFPRGRYTEPQLRLGLRLSDTM